MIIFLDNNPISNNDGDRTVLIDSNRYKLKCVGIGSEGAIFTHPLEPTKIIKIFHPFLDNASFEEKNYVSKALDKLISRVPKEDIDILYKNGIIFPTELVKVENFNGGYSRKDIGESVSLSKYRYNHRIETIAYFYLLMIQVKMLTEYGIISVDTDTCNFIPNSDNPSQLLNYDFGYKDYVFDYESDEYNYKLDLVISNYYMNLLSTILDYFKYDKDNIHEYDYEINDFDDIFIYFPSLKEYDEVLRGNLSDIAPPKAKMQSFMEFIKIFSNNLNELDKNKIKMIIKK